MRVTLLWATLLSVVGCGLSARILAMLPFPGKSHYIFYSSVLRSLAQNGHQVVVYGPFPPKKPIPNYTHVQVDTSFGKKVWSFQEIMEFAEESSFFGIGGALMELFLFDLCEETFENENVKKLLASDEHFDLVVTTSTFGQESMVAFGHRFRAPTVTLQAFSYSGVLNREAGNALSIASVPDALSFTFTNQMTFKERLQNFLSISLTLLIYYSYILPKQDAIVKKHYQSPDTPYLGDMITNISLYLINAHPALQYSQPYTPNIIPIGGFSIVPERIPLPKDLQKFMDEAKDGVIYFSFGTVVPAEQLPKEMLQAFVNGFKKLPQRVLWKTELESIPGLSENVKLVKWVPQPGVLAHPNCVLFITHGGVFGQLEAIDAGVPTVGIPFFGDQPFNVRFNEHQGIGVKLDFRDLSEETVYRAIKTVLDNPKYKENTARMSAILRDQPVSPSDSAVFWVDYVLKHQGAAHLRSAAAQLPWYQLALLDVLAVLVAALLTVCVTVYLVLRKLCSLVFDRSKQTKVSRGKKIN